MRGFYSDGDYFAYLDALRDGGQANTVLAASFLVREFPGLRPEEARAVCADACIVCADWRATYHERRLRAAR